MVKKEISSVKNWKESFCKTAWCSVSSCYRVSVLPSRCPTKTILVKFANWYLQTHRGLQWKGKYLPVKTGKKLSEELSCVLLIHPSSYSFPLNKPFTKAVLGELAMWYLEAHRGLLWKWKYPKIKTEKKLSEKLLCVVLVYLTELQLSPQEVVHQDCSCEICKVIFGSS